MSDTSLVKDCPTTSGSAHDWEAEKNQAKEFSDDGNVSFLSNAHSLTCLVLICMVLMHEAFFDTGNYTTQQNTSRGLLAACIGFLIYGMIYGPDGPFRRPHPAFWRTVLSTSLLYELMLLFILFQNLGDAQKWLQRVDPDLGKPLKELRYAEDCRMYDANSSDPWHIVKDKLDVFVLGHLGGWWVKTLILRDVWLCNMLSLGFELLEYALEHQLPNFAECWWDHWLMDFFGCNLLGIYFGMRTLHHLRMKPYHWRNMWRIPGYTGKLKRVALQFTPHRWTDFNWQPNKSFRRWLSVLLLIAMMLQAELNYFYLKCIFWIPPAHYVCVCRMVMLSLMGMTAVREWFQFCDDPLCVKLGQQCWLMVCIIVTELLIVAKFGWNIVTKPPPLWVSIVAGCTFSVLLILWPLWNFYFSPWLLNRTAPPSKKKRSLQQPSNGNNGHFTGAEKVKNL